MAPVNHELISLLSRRLAETPSLRAIYLFGSQAYGAPRPESDIDLMLVFDDAAALTVEDRKALHARLRGLCLPIELHLRRQREFDRFRSVPSSVEYEVATRGRLLYAA